MSTIIGNPTRVNLSHEEPIKKIATAHSQRAHNLPTSDKNELNHLPVNSRESFQKNTYFKRIYTKSAGQKKRIKHSTNEC